MTSQEKIREILLEILPILNFNNIKYWVDCGTLLGIIRDGDIIEWDDDADLGVLYTSENWKKLLICIKSIDKFIFAPMNGIRPRFYYTEPRSHEPWIDFYGWVDKETANMQGRYSSIETGFHRGLWPYKNHIGTPVKIQWKGIDIFIPQNPEERLIHLYGKSWKNPIKKIPYW